MLLLARYLSALYLFFVVVSCILVGGNALLSSKDAALKMEAVLGVLVFGVALGIPYYFTYRATKTTGARDVRFAIVASTGLLAICAVSVLFGFVANPILAFAGLLWGLPSLFAVNALGKLPIKAADSAESQPGGF